MEMKLLDAINRVDRSPANATDPDWCGFCDALGISDYSCWNEEFLKLVQGYWLVKWICTDTWVGMAVYYYLNLPVAITTQTARKSDVEYQFVSAAAAKILRDLILTLIAKQTPESAPALVNPSDTIDGTYSVSYSSQLLTKTGLVNGRPCEVIDAFRHDYISKEVLVKFEDDGSTQKVSIGDFKIPLALTSET